MVAENIAAMKKYTFILILSILLISNHAVSMSRQEMVDDAKTIINLFYQQYGPLKWKELNLGINFKDISEKFIEDAGKASSDKEFYRLVIDYLSNFKDAHVSYYIPSSLVSYLPFGTEYFKDGVVIKYIDRNKLNRDDYPFESGDKLIAIDDIPVEQVIDSLSPYEENGYEPTNRKIIGSALLTYRSQEKIIDVPSGKAKITYYSRKNNSTGEVYVDWIQKGVDVAEMPPKSAISYMSELTRSIDDSLAMSPIEEFERSHYIEIPETDISSGYLMGDPRPFFPMWETFEKRMESPYFSGVFTVEGHKIGFIRIESWVPGNYQYYIEKFAQEIEYFNHNTEALVLDQTSNGGGNICYPFKIGSFFITKPMPIMKFQLRANRSHLARIEDWESYGSPDEFIHAKGWISALRKAVENGEYLSAPISAFCDPNGLQYPYRDKNEVIKVYIKPLLILTNELDFSAADMFPALMKDWGAAKIFGARTAGAGGNVVQSNYIGNSEMSIRITQSLMYRSTEVPVRDGLTTHYVENVGVEPDYYYEPTTEDYYNGYKGYREALNKAVLDIISHR